MNFNLISKKQRVWVLSGNSVLVVNQKQNWKNAPRHTTPSPQTATRVDESEGLRCRVRAAASLFFFLEAQDRKLSLSGCLGWAEGALEHHVRNGNGGAAIEVSNVSSVFLLVCSVLVMVGRSSRSKKLFLRPP